MTVERVVDALAGLLDARDRRTAPLQEARVLGRYRDGALQLQRTDQECVGRGCVTPEAAGEIVRRPAGPCWSRQGTTGVAGLSDRGTTRTLLLTSLDPHLFAPGNAYTVVAEGRGFEDGLAVDFLLAGEDLHPGLTVDAVRVLSDTRAELDLTVAPDAEPVTDAPVAYGPPTEELP